MAACSLARGRERSAELEKLESAAARERSGQRTDLKETFLEVDYGQTRDKVAATVGVSAGPQSSQYHHQHHQKGRGTNGRRRTE